MFLVMKANVNVEVHTFNVDYIIASILSNVR
jgi:hypothetical protein